MKGANKTLFERLFGRFSKLLIVNGGQGRDRTADASLFRAGRIGVARTCSTASCGRSCSARMQDFTSAGGGSEVTAGIATRLARTSWRIKPPARSGCNRGWRPNVGEEFRTFKKEKHRWLRFRKQAHCLKSTWNSTDSSKRSKDRLSQKVRLRKAWLLGSSNSARCTARRSTGSVASYALWRLASSIAGARPRGLVTGHGPQPARWSERRTWCSTIC